MLVYGFNWNGRDQLIVKVKSRAAVKRAMEALGHQISDARLRDYGSETFNTASIAAAEEAGEGVVLVRDDRNRTFRKLEPGNYRPAARRPFVPTAPSNEPAETVAPVAPPEPERQKVTIRVEVDCPDDEPLLAEVFTLTSTDVRFSAAQSLREMADRLDPR